MYMYMFLTDIKAYCSNKGYSTLCLVMLVHAENFMHVVQREEPEKLKLHHALHGTKIMVKDSNRMFSVCC